MLSTISGLPAHPLLVHLAVVAVPVAALLVILASLGRGRLALWARTPAVVVSAISVAATLIARSSGEAFAEMKGHPEHDLGPIAPHATFATYSLVAAGVLFLCSLAIWWLTRPVAVNDASATGPVVGAGTGGTALLVLRIVSIAVAIALIVLIVITGHQGAELVWMDE